jgi:hypothetical protein
MWQRKKMVTGMAAALAFLAVPLAGGAAEPETMELNSLARLYTPVSFDHSMHVEVVEGDCARCHHHTLGTGKVNGTCGRCHEASGMAQAIACRDCHAAERFGAEYLREMEQEKTRYHLDKPGLKAAYHMNCMGCHREFGGPTGCQDCHALTESGEAFYRTGKHAPAPAAEGHGPAH